MLHSIFTNAKTGKFHINELITFLKALVQLCIDAGAKKLGIDDLNDALLAKTKLMEDAYAYQKNSPITQEINYEEHRRNDAVTGIKAVCEGFEKHEDPTIKAAAKTVLAVYKKYSSNITHLTANAKSEEIDKLVTDFKTDALVVAALATLGCSSWVIILNDANTKFKTKYLERTKEYANQPTQTALDLKPETIAAYYNLLKRIESLDNIDKTDKYKPLIASINTLITQNNTTIAKREAGSGSSGDAGAKGGDGK